MTETYATETSTPSATVEMGYALQEVRGGLRRLAEALSRAEQEGIVTVPSHLEVQSGDGLEDFLDQRLNGEAREVLASLLREWTEYERDVRDLLHAWQGGDLQGEGHDHDDRYADPDHEHDDYLTEDTVEAWADGRYAPDDHDHGDAYAEEDHEHDDYLTEDDADERYAAARHNHEGEDHDHGLDLGSLREVAAAWGDGADWVGADRLMMVETDLDRRVSALETTVERLREALAA